MYYCARMVKVAALIMRPSASHSWLTADLCHEGWQQCDKAEDQFGQDESRTDLHTCANTRYRNNYDTGLVRTSPQNPILGRFAWSKTLCAFWQWRLLQRDAECLGTHGITRCTVLLHILLYFLFITPAWREKHVWQTCCFEPSWPRILCINYSWW